MKIEPRYSGHHVRDGCAILVKAELRNTILAYRTGAISRDTEMAQLFRLLIGPICLHLRYKGWKEQDDLDEIFQRFMRKLVGIQDRLDPDGGLVSYLWGMARTIAIDYSREKARDRRRSSSLPERENEQPSDKGEASENLQRAILLRSAMSKLSEEDRTMLELLGAGLTLREIASEVQMPPTTVRDRIKKALNTLRQIMGEISSVGA